MTGYFVTGTDTDVGKTTVAAALLAAARARGLAARCFKPAESGCTRTPDGLHPSDAARLAEAAGDLRPLADICPYQFEPAVAPGVAADVAGTTIDFGYLKALAQAADRPGPGLLLIEGAGGLLVPFGNQRLAADLATALELPLVIVARASLGTINHTLLTIEAARARGLEPAGVIFTNPSGPTPQDAAASNAEQIASAQTHPVPHLGTLPYLADTSLAALAAAAEQHLDIDALL